MALSSTQSTVFEATVGHTPADMSGTIALMVGVAFFLWAAWVVLFRMQQWKKGTSDLNDLVWATVRVGGLLLLVFVFIR